MSEHEHDPAEPAPQADPALAARGGPASAPLIARTLALQASAGNRAVVCALARAPTTIRENVSEARLGGRAAYTGLVTYDVEFTGGNCQITLKVRLVPDRGVPATDVTRVQEETAREFARIWDNKFEFTDTTTFQSQASAFASYVPRSQ